jgi:predicted transcriptional regulator
VAHAGRRPFRDPHQAFSRCGPLETRVLEALWASGGEVSGRDVHAAFPALAYTTVMTTLDRLHRKALLARRQDGRACLYRPLHSREQLTARVAADALAELAGRSGGERAAPLLSSFVDAVGERDRALLDELERLVRARRRGARRR